MVYIFKKVNSLVNDGPSPGTASGQVIAEGGNTAAVAGADPHASTYQNPNKIYQANLGENLGNLDTGIGKNISDTQRNLTDSGNDYTSKLSNVDSGYKYNGMSDLQNISDPNTFSRLSSLVNPAGEQTQLKGITSNTANYNPDTSNLAASSTVSGLSNQLKDQYGTTAGGSRLDAQLYRGSGQAGKAINSALGQLGDFRADKENRLTTESNLLNQYNQNALDRSNQLKTEGTNYQNQLKSESAAKGAQVQNQYDTQRQQAIGNLTNVRDSTNYQQQMLDAINQTLGNSRITKNFDGIDNSTDLSDYLQRNGYDEGLANQLAQSARYQSAQYDGGGRDRQQTAAAKATVDLTNYLRNQVQNQFTQGLSLNQFDPSKYVSEARTFDPNAYLDPRYNQIGQLLGKPQIAGAVNPSDVLSSDQGKLQSDIKGYLDPQIANAQAAIQQLMQGQSLVDPNNGNNYANLLATIIKNPVFGGALLGGATTVPGVSRPALALQQGLGNTVENVGNQIGSIFGGGGW